MPNSVVKAFAEKSGKSEEEVEKLWKETQEDIKAQFKYKTPAFWAYLNKTVQKKLGIKEERLSFKDYVILEKEEPKQKKEEFKVGQSVQLVKPLKDIEANIDEVFSVIDVCPDSGDIKISNSFGPEYQDKYFSKKNFKAIEE